MGWIFSTRWDRASLIRERCETRTGTDYSYETLARATVGNVLWKVMEITRDGKKERYIGCDLLQNGGKGHGWGYKDICETMGPVQDSCPLSFLALVPPPLNDDGTPQEYAALWRERVYAYHARKDALRDVKPGDVLILRGLRLKRATVARARPLIATDENYARYRIPSKYVVGIERGGERTYTMPPPPMTKAEIAEEAALNAGQALRCSAMGQDNGLVHVLFKRRDGSTEGRYMTSGTYDAIPLLTIATPEDYATAAARIGAPPPSPAPNDFSWGDATKETA